MPLYIIYIIRDSNMAFEHGDTFMAQSALQRHMTKAQMAAQKHDHDHPVPLWLLRKTANRENKSDLLKHHTRHDVERIVAKELSAEIMEASESVVLLPGRLARRSVHAE